NVLVLQRERGGAKAILSVFGRDTEDQRLALAWDFTTATWSLVGPVGAERPEDPLSEEREEILRLLRDAGKPLTPKEASDALGKSNGAVRVLLGKMAKAGSLRSDRSGHYSIVEDSNADEPRLLS